MALKKLKDIYSGYFQKSKSLLFPLLDIPHNKSVTPIQTYVTWEDKFELEDCKLITVFYFREDAEYQVFEQRHLIGNKYFEDWIDLGDGRSAYVFDLTDNKHDFQFFIEGRYSKFSNELKKLIKKYHGEQTPNYAVLDSYLYPSKYYDDYADFLCPDKKDTDKVKQLLEKVGELCNKPDLEKEECIESVQQLDLK